MFYLLNHMMIDFTGPIRLYEKAGFTRIMEQNGQVIMRKVL